MWFIVISVGILMEEYLFFCFCVNESTVKAHANEETSTLEGQHNLIPIYTCARNTTTFVGTKYVPDLMQNTANILHPN